MASQILTCSRDVPMYLTNGGIATYGSENQEEDILMDSLFSFLNPYSEESNEPILCGYFCHIVKFLISTDTFTSCSFNH